MSVFLPLQLISDIRRYARTSAALVRSPFNNSGQVQDWGGEWWEYELEFDIHVQREGPRMSAFWVSLGGPRTPFLLRDPSFQSSAAGAPVVSGAGQTGYSLTTSGWPANTTVLQAGDAFQLGSGLGTRLHQLTQDVVSGSGGVATMVFWPALRESPANGAPLVVASPAVCLRLTEDVPAVIGRAAIHRFSVKAVEAL